MDELVYGDLYWACQAGVDRLIHDTRRDSFHERFEVGKCPLCTPAQNLLAKSRFKERIEALKEQMGTP